MGDGGIDGVGVLMCAHDCVYVCQTVGVCDNPCMSTEPLHGEVIAHWPFVGVRLGSSDACYRRGVWEPTGDGGGGKR